MTFAGDADGADRLAGAVRPEELGTFNVVLRVSTDDGRTWAYADRGGIVTAGDAPWGYRPDQAVTLAAVAAADADPPPAPASPRVATVAASSLTLAWDPVTAPDLYRYEVLRGTPGRSVRADRDGHGADLHRRHGRHRHAYVYVVTAVDTSFNRSAYSAEAAASAQTRAVAVTFVVTVPPNTPAADTLFIAGDFQGWDPAATPMTRVDDRTWSITLPFTEGDAPQYKYTRGSWEAVEKDDACGEIPNRTFSVTSGRRGRRRSRTRSRSGATSTSAAEPAARGGSRALADRPARRHGRSPAYPRLRGRSPVPARRPARRAPPGAADVEGKLPRALVALGPPAAGDVALLDDPRGGSGPPGCAGIAAGASRSPTLRLDGPDGSLDASSPSGPGSAASTRPPSPRWTGCCAPGAGCWWSTTTAATT